MSEAKIVAAFSETFLRMDGEDLYKHIYFSIYVERIALYMIVGICPKIKGYGFRFPQQWSCVKTDN